MRPVDAIGRAICTFQGKVFERSASLLPHCSSAVFVRRFMRSEEASRADEMGSFDPGITEESVVNTVDAAYGRKPYGSETYPPEVLYWMGYVYRYWVLASGTSSRHVHAACGAREMRDLYLAFHALDPAQCVERILEAKGMSIDVLSDANLERRALEILRRRRRA